MAQCMQFVLICQLSMCNTASCCEHPSTPRHNPTVLRERCIACFTHCLMRVSSHCDFVMPLACGAVQMCGDLLLAYSWSRRCFMTATSSTTILSTTRSPKSRPRATALVQRWQHCVPSTSCTSCQAAARQCTRATGSNCRHQGQWSHTRLLPHVSATRPLLML